MATSGHRPLLACEGLGVSYLTRAGEIPAVVGFDLAIAPGEAVGLVGESGCGKSTVALAVMRYLGRSGRIVAGSIRFDGRELTTMSERELRRIRGSRISMVYQEPMASLNPSMTVGRQLVEVPRYHGGAGRAEARERALDMLARVGLPDTRRIFAAYPHELSGGQQQRVVIAMALLADPALLLLDEPTTALDVTVEAGIVDLIRGVAERFGTAVLYISHNLGLIRETCDRVAVMYAGEVVEEGTVDEVFAGMRHPYTRGLFAAVPLPDSDRRSRRLRAIPGRLPLPGERPEGCVFGPRCEHFREGVCDRPQGMRAAGADGGHRVRCARQAEIAWKEGGEGTGPSPARAPGRVVLEVRGLRKEYPLAGDILSGFPTVRTPRITANDRIDLVVREGETLAIVGESGCGKSTLAKVLVGLEPATGGRITFEGREIARAPVERRTPDIVARLQMVFQNPFETLNPSHTVGFQIARVVRRFGLARTGAEARRRVRELLDLVKLPGAFAIRKPRQLSGGQKQRVGIARAFAGQPRLVIADEPVSALDVSVQAAITGLLTDIQEQRRTTLLFISHDLSLVRYLADRVAVMYLGRIVEQGTADAVFRPPYHPYTEALLSAVPLADPGLVKTRILLEGDPPSALDPPKGCPFHPRCPRRLGSICEEREPPLRRFDGDHRILCHLSAEELTRGRPVIRRREPRETSHVPLR